ncbi:MAG: DMT family transporter [Gaiellaceae bacterium]
MTGGTALAVVLSALAGLAGSVQIAVMGKLGERVGALEALAFALTISALVAFTALLVVGHGVGGAADALREPIWLWSGGLMGVFIVFTITVAAPRIGTTATIGILIAGQLAMGAVIDRYGLFGLDEIALSWPRVLGIALLAVGAALSLHQG